MQIDSHRKKAVLENSLAVGVSLILRLIPP